MAYLGVQPLKGQNRTIDDISASFNGANVTFNLASGGFALTPATAYQLFISVGGVLQNPGVDFTVNGNQITLTTAPAAGLSFWGLYQGDAIDSVSISDGSITTAKLATGLTVTLGAGSASTPSLTFAGDTNNGIYTPGADQLSITTGGTERFRFDSNGQFEAVSLGSAGTPTFTYVGDPNTGTFSPGADTWGVTTGGTERVRVTSAGFVGIGTNSPVTTLHNAGTRTAFGKDGSNLHWFMTGDSNSEPNALGYGFESVAGVIQSHRWFTTGSQRASIDSSGRLLVGTSTARANFFNSTFTAAFQVEGTDASTSNLSIVANRGGSGALLTLASSKGTSIGSNTLVSNGDGFGAIEFCGSDGTEFVVGAEIKAEADAATGANDMPGRLVFSTTADGASSPTERARVNSNGSFGMLCVSGVDTLYVSNGTTAGTAQLLISGRHTASSVYAGTESFRVFTNGNVQNTNNSYAGISDIKLKENVVDATSQWSDIKALQVRKYNFKEETGQQTHTQIGLIAQEVELVSPGLVSESPDRDAEGNDLGTVTKSVNYSVLYMKAVKALQEAMERIETLEAKVTALEGA